MLVMRKSTLQPILWAYDESSSNESEVPYATYMANDEEVSPSNNPLLGRDVKNAHATIIRAKARKRQKGGPPIDDELAHNET